MSFTVINAVQNGKPQAELSEMQNGRAGNDEIQVGSGWENIPRGMKDPIFKITQIFRNDPDERRVNLSVGVYQNEKGQQYEFESVRDAREAYEKSWQCAQHGYLPPTGHFGFCLASAQLIFGGCVRKERLTTIQTVSGSGALRLAMEFSRRFLRVRRVYLSNPTWANHNQLAKDTSLKVSRYRYYDVRTGTARSDWVSEDLKQAEIGSLVVFQACGHNPTGADLNSKGWNQVLNVVLERKLIPLFDVAYQGLVSGDVEEDVSSVRLFARSVGILVAHSLSKSMGLYGERVGTLSVVTPNGVSVVDANSQLQCLVRGMYSSPPTYGAKVASMVLTDERRHSLWQEEIRQMASRMRRMRRALVDRLPEDGRWSFINDGHGMFTCLGLSFAQVVRLRDIHHVYLTEDSRVNLAGLTEHNVNRVAMAIREVAYNSQSHQIED